MGVLGELGSLSTSRVQTPEGERTLPDTPDVWLGFLPIFFFRKVSLLLVPPSLFTQNFRTILSVFSAALHL